MRHEIFVITFTCTAEGRVQVKLKELVPISIDFNAQHAKN